MNLCVLFLFSNDFAMQAGFDIQQQTQLISTVNGQHSNLSQIREHKTDVPLISGDVQVSSSENMDLNDFLRYHHENVVSSTIQECRLLTARTFRERYNQSMEDEWMQTKNELLRLLGCNNHQFNAHSGGSSSSSSGISMNNNTSAAAASCILPPSSSSLLQSFKRNYNSNIEQMQENTNKTAEPIARFAMDSNENINLDVWDIGFSAVVNKLCENRFQNDHHKFIAPFKMFAIEHHKICIQYFKQKQRNNDNNNYQEFDQLCMEDIWECLSIMVNEQSLNGLFIPDHILSEKCYEHNINNPEFHQFLSVNAKNYLEQMFMYNIKSEVKNNMKDNIHSSMYLGGGGMQHNISFILAYVRMQFADNITQHIMVKIKGESYPLYPLLYYCLRAGEIKEAVNISGINVHSSMIKRAFQMITEQKDRSSSTFWIQTFNPYYYKHISHSNNNIDTYEVLLYLILGKIVDSTMDNWIDLYTVLSTTEDCIWYELCYINMMMINNETSLISLQKKMRDLGPNHYKNTYIYVKTLMLTQQFETAVQFLCNVDLVQGIHVALSLNYYGLLSIPNINLFDKIRTYCNRLLNANNNQIQSYFIFYYLYLMNCKQSINQLIQYLSIPNWDLVLQLLNTISKYSYQPTSDLCLKSAMIARENGEIVHSIQLFIHGEHYSTAAKVCIKLLSTHMKERVDSSKKKRALIIAHNLTKQKDKKEYALHKMSVNESTNLMIAIAMCEFFNHFTCGNFDKAFRIISHSKIIPIHLQNYHLLNNAQKQEIFAPYLVNIAKLEIELLGFVPEICFNLMRIIHSNLSRINVGLKQNQNKFNPAKKKLIQICSILYQFYYSLPSSLIEQNKRISSKIDEIHSQIIK